MESRLAGVLALGLVWMLPALSSAATLGPWTVAPSTNSNSAHSGVAGVPGHLYTVTVGGGVEHAVIAPDESLGAWSLANNLNSARVFAVMAVWGNHLYVAGGWAGSCCRPAD